MRSTISFTPEFADLAMRWQQPRKTPPQVPCNSPFVIQHVKKNSHDPPSCWHCNSRFTASPIYNLQVFFLLIFFCFWVCTLRLLCVFFSFFFWFVLKSIGFDFIFSYHLYPSRIGFNHVRVLFIFSKFLLFGISFGFRNSFDDECTISPKALESTKRERERKRKGDNLCVWVEQ